MDCVSWPNDQTEATAGAAVDAESAARVGVKIEHLRHRAPAVASSDLFAFGWPMVVCAFVMVVSGWISVGDAKVSSQISK